MVGWLAREGTPRWGTLLKLNSNSKGRAAGETGSGNKGELRTKVNEQNVGDLKKERALKQRRRVRTEYDFGPRGAICAGGDGDGRYGDGLLTLQG